MLLLFTFAEERRNLAIECRIKCSIVLLRFFFQIQNLFRQHLWTEQTLWLKLKIKSPGSWPHRWFRALS